MMRWCIVVWGTCTEAAAAAAFGLPLLIGALAVGGRPLWTGDGL